MNVNEATALAKRLESIIRRSRTFAHTTDELRMEILFVAEDLMKYADELDADMYNELGTAYEKYDDAMVVG